MCFGQHQEEAIPLLGNLKGKYTWKEKKYPWRKKTKTITCIILEPGLVLCTVVFFVLSMYNIIPGRTDSTTMMEVNMLRSLSPVTSNNGLFQCCDDKSSLIVSRKNNSLLEYNVFAGNCTPDIKYMIIEQATYVYLSEDHWSSIITYKWLGPNTFLSFFLDIICNDDYCTGSSIKFLIIDQDHYKTLDCKYGNCFTKPLDSDNTTLSFNIANLPPKYYFIMVQLNGTSNVMARWVVNGTYGNYTLNSDYTKLCHVSKESKEDCFIQGFQLTECIFIHTNTTDPTASPRFYYYTFTHYFHTEKLNIENTIFLVLFVIFLVPCLLFPIICCCVLFEKNKPPHQVIQE